MIAIDGSRVEEWKSSPLDCGTEAARSVIRQGAARVPSGNLPPLGGMGNTVEIDETFIGKKQDKAAKVRGYAHNHAVMTLVQRGGSARSFLMDGTKATDLLPIIKANVLPGTRLMTDEAALKANLGIIAAEAEGGVRAREPASQA